MKKVAITTIESMNFGNRLQNYALQEILKLEKCEVKTLHRNIKNTGVKPAVKTVVQNMLQTKAAKFRQFDSLIDYSDITVTKDDYPHDLYKKFDCFIVGSDQVWNPHYDFVAGKCDFLAFAKDNQKISYAASFGVNEIPDERKKEFAENLKTFKAISVREKQGAKIVKDLTDREATVVLDPTLLLDENEWRMVEKKSRCCPKRQYVFVYALGDKNDRFKEKIKELREKYEIFDVRTIQKNGKELPVGPSEFLYLLRNAEIILTDSFHATVFSIIFHKRFITFNRSGLNMNSRVESLAELVGLTNRINANGDFDCEAPVNYTNVDTILKEERRKSKEFLTKALDYEVK